MKTLLQKSTRPVVENLSTCFVLKLPVEKPVSIRENILWGALSEFSLYNRENIFVMPFPGTDLIPKQFDGNFLNELLDKIEYEYGHFVFVEKIC